MDCGIGLEEIVKMSNFSSSIHGEPGHAHGPVQYMLSITVNYDFLLSEFYPFHHGNSHVNNWVPP